MGSSREAHRELSEREIAGSSSQLRVWFQDGIESDLFTPVRAAIMTDRARFSTFEAVKDAYIDFARQQIKHDNSSRNRRSVSAVHGRGGRSSTRPQGRGGPRSSRGRDYQADRKAGIPSQIEVNKCTHIQNKQYSWEEYKKFTLAERQRHYQLRNPDAKPGTGPSRGGRRGGGSSNVSAMTNSTESKNSKKRNRDGREKDNDDDSDGTDDADDKNKSNRANARQTK